MWSTTNWKNSTESMGEIFYRLFLIREAVFLYYYFGHGLRETYENSLDETPQYRVRGILATNAFINVYALLDGSGNFSLKARKNKTKFAVSEDRLRSLFPILSREQITTLLIKLNKVFLNHASTLSIVFRIRNQKLAHMGQSMRMFRAVEDYSIYSHRNPIPKRFAYRKLLDFVEDMEDALDEAAITVEFAPAMNKLHSKHIVKK